MSIKHLIVIVLLLLPSTSFASVNFDGLDDVVQVTETTGLPIYSTTGYSVAFWVKGATNQVNKIIFGEGNSAINNPILLLGTNSTGLNGKLAVHIRDNASIDQLNAIDSATTVFDNTWHHVVWADLNGTAALYVDGKKDATNYNYTPSSYTFNRDAIGAIIRATNALFFAGSVADVRLYNRALSPIEAFALSRGFLWNTNGLLAWFPLFGTGDIEPDYSGRRNFGVPTSFTVNRRGSSNPPLMPYYFTHH